MTEASLLAYIFEANRQHRNKIARARRLLRRWALRLHTQHGLYCVVDHIGVPRGAPFERPIEEVLAWIAKTPSGAAARGEVDP